MVVANEVGDKLEVELFKEVNTAWTQSKKLESSGLLKGHQECMTQDAVSSPMEEHHGLEALKVIKRVDGPIVELGLGHPKLWRDGLTYDIGGKG